VSDQTRTGKKLASTVAARSSAGSMQPERRTVTTNPKWLVLLPVLQLMLAACGGRADPAHSAASTGSRPEPKRRPEEMRIATTFTGDESAILVGNRRQVLVDGSWEYDDNAGLNDPRGVDPIPNFTVCLLTLKAGPGYEQPGRELTTDQRGQIHISMTDKMFQPENSIYSKDGNAGWKSFWVAEFWIVPKPCSEGPFGHPRASNSPRHLPIVLNEWHGYTALQAKAKEIQKDHEAGKMGQERKPYEEAMAKCKSGDANACFACAHSKCEGFYILDNGKRPIDRACELHHAQACEEVKARAEAEARAAQEAQSAQQTASVGPGMKSVQKFRGVIDGTRTNDSMNLTMKPGKVAVVVKGDRGTVIGCTIAVASQNYKQFLAKDGGTSDTCSLAFQVKAPVSVVLEIWRKGTLSNVHYEGELFFGQ
jgi:hypothetical protein